MHEMKKKLTNIQRTVEFGVGCLHFALKYTEPIMYSHDSYCDDLRTTLEGIDTISEVEINFEPIDQSQREPFRVDKKPNIMGDGSVFPMILFLDYNFNIYVPSRIQAEILEIDEEFSELETEHFRVTTFYLYYGPVTFIESIGANETISPSQAVIVVREYIERHLSQIQVPLELDCIGPSPFHGDMFLSEEIGSCKGSELFSSEFEQELGYDKFRFKTDIVESDFEWEKRKSKIYRLLANEFDYFYDLMRQRSRQIHAWSEIGESLSLLLNPVNSKGIYNRFRQYIAKRSAIKRLFHDIYVFRAEALFMEDSLRSSFRFLYSSGKSTGFLKNYIEEQKEDLYTYPTSETLEIVTFEEQRTSKNFELATVILASVLGGIVGAAVTIFLT